MRVQRVQQERPKDERLTADAGLTALRAIGEPTRLRILMLLTTGELTVKDLTLVLAQSQPRISRHLKLMHDAGLLTRVQEGSWVYFRLTDQPGAAGLLRTLLSQFDQQDAEFRRDRERAEAVRRDRFDKAQMFFAEHAGQWDKLRALHADEGEVEARILKLLSDGPAELLVDMGTGTGRILELLASRYERALGIDTNQEMLAYARARMQGPEYAHVQVRQGDIGNVSLAEQAADTVIMHQVLHYLTDPRPAIVEAARILRPGGKVLIVDFAAHKVDRLRDEFAHHRLGFSNEQMARWLINAGLKPTIYEELPPSSPGRDDSLTVAFWLAEPTAAARGRDTKTMEIAR